jgi:beta-lactam-binding protein with PASTA domain
VSTRRLLGGRYEIGEVIGRGGMADVHAGFDTRLSRPVAIKLLRSDLARDSVFLSRFRREAQSSAGLNHPNIVAIYDSGEDESLDPTTGVTVHVPYIVMEVVDGRTLREHLTATGPMGAVEAGRIVEDVLAALDYSHSKGIVHRDIKPANVMLGRGGAVKVMDFGIARAIADSAATMTQTQSVVGTAQYLSPEQAQGKPVDARSDLYSTGCMLFELLTGRTPFVGETAVAIAYQHVGEAAAPPSTIRSAVPAAYDAITLHAMVKDREARYQSAPEFRDDLIAAREGRPVSAAALGSAAGARPGLAGASATVGSSATTTVFAEVTAADPVGVPPDRMPLDDDEDAPLSRSGRRAAQEPPKRRGAAYVLLTLAALAALAVLFLLGRSILAQNAKPEQVAVPYLINQTEDQARALLSTRKLVMTVVNVTNATVAKGLIVDQDPDSDTMVNVGTSVQVMVSSGPGQAAIPAVAGLNRDAAVTQLKLLGFNSLGVLVVDDPAQPKDAVISTDPPIGSVIPFTNQITLKVASGKVAVPQLVDLNQITAQAALSGLKLKYAVAEKVPTADTTVLEGTVLSQDVPAGTLVDVGSTVNVKIAIRIASTVTVTSPPPTSTSSSTATSTG